MKIALQNILWFIFFVAHQPHQYLCLAKHPVTIGIFFRNENYQSEMALDFTLRKKNAFNWNFNFKSDVEQVSNIDYFDTSKTLCKVLETNDGARAVISLESPTSDILESMCAHFEVPYITTSWRPPATRKSSTVFNFFPEANLFAHALAEVVKSLRWESFVIIYENDEGLIRMREILKQHNFKHNNKHNNILIKQLGSGLDHRSILKEIRATLENNIILDCKTEHIIPILKQAKDQNLLSLNNNYFLTSLDAHTLDYTELKTAANITTITLFDYNSKIFKDVVRNWQGTYTDYGKNFLESSQIKTETALFYDALQVVTDSISDFYTKKNITSDSISCHNDTKSKNGYTFAAYMKKKKPSKTLLSGPLKFNENGNRVDFNIHVVDIIDNQIIADWHADNNTLILRRNFAVAEIAENLQNIIVNVSSRIGAPFLMYKEAAEGEILYGNDRYEGYSMDLINYLADINRFKFEFHITEDGEYGKWDEKKKIWTGIIGDVLDGKAQLGICDLTITHQRTEAVDFSTPFMTLGIGILYQRETYGDVNVLAFLAPFSLSVWIYTATLYLIISVILYFISRITAGDWENPHPCNENPEELENIWNIKNCLWLTLGSIMAQGCDILPKGISSRMIISMMWFFSLVMACLYTANLAVFLSIDKAEFTIDSAEDLSQQTKIKYGMLDGGSTMAFFKNSDVSTYQRMWLEMISSKPSVFEKNNRDGVMRVQNSNGRYAFLMESTQIEYETQTKCDLTQVGNTLDLKSYGIAMPKNSPYRKFINIAILQLQEYGGLIELKNKWWKERRTEPLCHTSITEEESDDAKLNLDDVGGVFFILGIGITIAIVLAIFEFLWNVRIVSVEENLTYFKALKLELKFACDFRITKKRTKPITSETSCSGSSKATK